MRCFIGVHLLIERIVVTFGLFSIIEIVQLDFSPCVVLMEGCCCSLLESFIFDSNGGSLEEVPLNSMLVPFVLTIWFCDLLLNSQISIL